MRHKETDRFLADFGRLSEQERRLFMLAVRRMNESAGPHPASVPHWPAGLRVKHLEDHPGVYAMTWSFAGPDGRATFELLREVGELVLRWRRVGGHRILHDP